jgi:hypothetical protein
MKYRYAYSYTQSGPTKVELFGRDSRMTNDELELMRRELNKQPGVYVKHLALVFQQGGFHIFADSRKSTLAPEPLFVVE